jgi:Tol biopolymer transport system component
VVRAAAVLLLLAVVPASGAERAVGRVRPHPYDYEPAWSPHGRYLAFTRDDELRVMAPDGTHVRAVPGFGAFSWSQSGRLAFSRRDEDGWHLWSSKPNGSELRQLTFGRVRDARPAWSPDGRSLLFVRGREPERTDVWRVAADGNGLRRLTSDGHSFLSYLDHVWSPDGRRFAFVSCAGRKCASGRNDVFVMSTKGGARRRLTWSDDNNTPTWSPDGRLVAYFTAKDTDLEHTSNAEIEVVRPDGSGRRSVTRSGSHHLQLAGNSTGMSWSPSGRRIVFDADSNEDYGRSELWMVDRDGGHAHPLLRRAQRERADDHMPAWSPDGRRIAWVRLYPDPKVENGLLFGSIHAGRVDGTHLMRLTY